MYFSSDLCMFCPRSVSLTCSHVVKQSVAEVVGVAFDSFS